MEYSFSPIPLPAQLIIKGGTTSNQVSWIGYLTQQPFLAPPNLLATQTFFSRRSLLAPLLCNNMPWPAYCSRLSLPELHGSLTPSSDAISFPFRKILRENALPPHTPTQGIYSRSYGFLSFALTIR
ncbi:MAG: hypothetical protein HS127_00465 [Planctomycetia bacterium]|nr:hypothetical protein [Planctomycetia bacterium]